MATLRDHYLAMARYNRWMNQRLYALSATLTDEERTRDLGAFFKSLHGTLDHLVLADRVWLGRFAGDSRRFESLDEAGRPIGFRGFDHILYPEFAALRREREKTDAQIDAWAASITDERLQQTLVYRSLAGDSVEHPLWWSVSHFFNHQTHHRGQATTLLMQLSHDPGVTDLIALLRTE